MRKKLIALLRSRRGQIVWSAVFVLVNVGLGLINWGSVWAIVSWAGAGFMLCNLLNTVMRDIYVRADTAEVNRNRENAQQQLLGMVEHVKGELDRFAAERGFDIDLQMEPGEPPSTPQT